MDQMRFVSVLKAICAFNLVNQQLIIKENLEIAYITNFPVFIKVALIQSLIMHVYSKQSNSPFL